MYKHFITAALQAVASMMTDCSVIVDDAAREFESQVFAITAPEIVEWLDASVIAKPEIPRNRTRGSPARQMSRSSRLDCHTLAPQNFGFCKGVSPRKINAKLRREYARRST